MKTIYKISIHKIESCLQCGKESSNELLFMRKTTDEKKVKASIDTLKKLIQ